MPLFKKGGASFADARKNEGFDAKKGRNARTDGANSGVTKEVPATTNLPSQPSRPEQTSTASRAETERPEKPAAAPPSTQTPTRFVFYCQLAHGSPTGKVEGFTNVRELYQKIARAFNIQASEILFCTLNTFRIDMERLLGGQIGLDDFIFAHIKGQKKKVQIQKTHPALGLTITDNGAGCAFIKRIKEGSIAANCPQICTGDHIEYINDKNLLGMRHFDVARMLRELPLGDPLILQLVEPCRGFEGIGPRTASRGGAANPVSEPNSKAADALGSGKATLRLRSKGPPVVEEVQESTAWELKATKKIDDLLESFIGIRDEDLANTLVDLGKDKTNPSDFALAVDKDFADFEFPDEFIFDIWGVVSDAKSGRM